MAFMTTTAELRLRQAFIASTVAGVVLSPVAILYNMQYDALSNERTPVIGDAQYKTLSAETDALIAKDRELFTLNKDIATMAQKQIASPNDTVLSDKLDKATIARDALHNTLKQDLGTVTTRLLMSEGIAETDAVEISQKFQNSYALKDQNAVYQSSFRMHNLDQCQTEYAQNPNTGKDMAGYVDSCLNSPKDLVQIGAFGATFGAFCGGIAFILLGHSQFQRRTEELKEQSLLEQEAKRLKIAKPKPENNDVKLEIIVRKK